MDTLQLDSRTQINRISNRELIYLIAVANFMIACLLELTILWAEDSTGILSKLTTGLKFLSMILCALKLVVQEYSKSTLALTILVLALFFAGMILTGNVYIFMCAVLVLAAKDCNREDVLVTTFMVQALILTFFTVMSLNGVITNYDFTIDGRIRFGLGFAWCTTAPIIFYFLMLQYICLRKSKITIVELVLMETINLFFYKWTCTRMTFFVSTIFIFCFFVIRVWQNRFVKRRMKQHKIVLGVMISIPFVLSLISYFTSYLYNENKEIWIDLNYFLSNRLRLGKSAIDEFGISFFARRIEWIGSSALGIEPDGYNYVDSSYLQLLLNYGILIFLCILALYCYGIYKMNLERDLFIEIVILFVLIHSLTEPRLINIAFNPLFILFFCESKHAGNKVICENTDI